MAYNTFLTTNNIQYLIGKTIKWNAPAYKGNKDNEGICIIRSYLFNERNPLRCSTIKGDNLEYAFLCNNNDIFSYSDEDRFVTFIITNNQQILSSEDIAKTILKEKGYIMHFWSKQDIRNKAKKRSIELSEYQVDKIANLLERKTDNDIINWNVIDFFINQILNEI